MQMELGHYESPLDEVASFDQYNPATCLEPVCQHPRFGLVTVADMNEALLNHPDATGRQLLNFLMTTGGTPC